jgi:lipopolysaccharide/colanic/teichoic acid biosynthesis glycosyltransferase
MKRFFDVFVSILGIFLLSPFFIILGLIIKIDNKGPVFFQQTRVGKNGKLFVIYKFRTMNYSGSNKGESFEPGKISSVTSFGKLLRKTKVDELPQLLNVLIGDMSLVGPRPEIEKWVAVYPERWKRILLVKPGITDNSSIVFRNEESLLNESNDPEKTYKEIILPMKLEFYEDFVLNHSFFGDLKIIFKTLYSIVFK